MENYELLKEIGLDEKEASVYLALLELGTSTVHGVATKAGLKRPTTYLILDKLEKKGLTSLIPKTKISLYVAQSPEKLLTDLHKKEQLLKSGLPDLIAIHNTNSEKPHIQLFQGKEGVESVYKKILTSKEVRFFATIRDVEQIYPQFPQDLITKAKRKEIVVKEILTKRPEDLKYAAGVQHDEYYEQRFSSGSSSFQTDNVLFDDTVVFFSYRPFIMAVVIASRDIYESMHTLFELAWQSAEPYDDVAKEVNGKTNVI